MYKHVQARVLGKKVVFLFSEYRNLLSSNDRLDQWLLIFLKSGNTFDYMKNLRNTEINDRKKQTKTSRVEINIF